MPYIRPEDRERYESLIRALADQLPTDKLGDLNYVVTRLMLWWLDKAGTSYSTLGDVVMTLECAKLEFVRRHMSPYEDAKIKENGDL